MSRAVFKWLLFASCLIIFLAAMGWVTARTLEMERQRLAAEKDAQIQERVRLALWRMDAIAGALVVRENARPASHYQAFYAPDDLFSTANREIKKGQALTPSPLLGELPEFVKLHFEMVGAAPGSVISPQVPTGNNLVLASNYAASTQQGIAAERLAKLNTLLRTRLAPAASAPEPPKAASRAGMPVPAQQAAVLPAAPLKSSTDAKDELMRKSVAMPAPVQPAPAPSDAAAARQIALNNSELIQRSNVVRGQIEQEKNESFKMPMKKSEAPPKLAAAASPAPAAAPSTLPAKPSAAAARPLAKNKEPRAAGDQSKTDSESQSLAAVVSRYRGDTQNLPAPGGAAAAAPQPADSYQQPAAPVATPPSPPAPAETTAALSLEPRASAPVPGDLAPRWIEGELLLLRNATLDGVKRTQGVWLDWPGLREKLLGAIHDLLPAAALTSTNGDGIGADPFSLASLPVRLAPGHLDLPVPTAWSPLQRALAIAWGCFGFAALAVGLVLNRAIVLSKRRGAFVSAVTHELRTPLTTFRLYSEMLADDMVPNADTRSEYLQTLCDESTRLTHLVENVLAYSRIERGRTAARIERISAEQLLRRIEPRLRQRAREVALDLLISAPDHADDTWLNVDALGVEQILFNLVDNACKYAAPASNPRELRLEITATAKEVVFRVRDHGPGISREQLQKLFQPFAKSATEAAHSAPGVGLGLALCKQLSRELGGELRLESNAGGACFALTLPRA